jgi:glycosyltransferase involved in cell wall biosynthesis
MQKPLVTVVMPCFNQAQYVQRSIRSVLDQDYNHVELIVADGGSADGTLNILKDMAASDGRLKWFSGEDNGPADAINKALSRCRGTVIGWLNSDDLYTPGAASRAVDAFSNNPDWIMVYGHGQHIDEYDGVIDTYPTKVPPQPLLSFAQGCFICQPTVFFKRSMHFLLGGLEPRWKTSFDFAYWCRVFSVFGDRIGFVDEVQAQSRLHSDCITCNQRRTIALEGMQLLYEHLGEAPAHWLLTYRNELLNGTAPLPANSTLEEELSSVLKKAWNWMNKEERRRVLSEFELDPLRFW